ncbi:hypothetical protein [Algoriphagus pacificus]|uniref:Lipocalin-like domain-containing protein n=1 Tax=Algoriphagus pacificus TaxID=2811234 RepID=A0ABS3CK52_9BACT|nr:hypothetical protein [Algoriphagus pacificus]MBN7817462.1 hypothetical protein [Algoriphagus pacificus]
MRIILSVFWLILFSTNISFSQKLDERFIGDWKVSNDDQFLSMEDKYSNFDKEQSLSSNKFKRLQASMSSREYSFFIDGKVSVGWKYEKDNFFEEGKWSLDDKYKLHLITHDTHLTYSFTFIGKNRLLMVPEGQEKGQIKKFELIKQ